MPHLNALNQYTHRSRDPVRNITAWEKARINELQPMDMWFYNYAKQMHNIRWQRYLNIQKGKADHIVDTREFLSKIPSDISGCKTTRYIISCPNGFYFHMPSGNNLTDRQQTLMLPKPKFVDNYRSSGVN